MRITTILTVLLVLAALAPAGSANHVRECPHDTRPFLLEDGNDTTYPVYVFVDEVATAYLFSVWIYGESNGEAGVQRHDDYCGYAGVTPDTQDVILF